MRKKAKLSKKDKWIIAIAIIISISVAVTAVIYTTKVIYTSIYSFGNFLYYHKPQGEFMYGVESPNGEYTVNAYLCNGGATVAYAVRGEVVNNETGEKRNIYWDYRIKTAEIEWINNDVVSINGHVLNIHTDSYDYRYD